MLFRSGDGVDAVGEDFRVAVVGDSSNGWYGGKWSGALSHKKISITDKLMIGWLSSVVIDPPVPIN